MTKKATKRDSQIYKLAAWGAVVTIEYDVNRPPPFFQPGPGVVIVGEHQCTGVLGTQADAAGQSRKLPSPRSAPPLRNFEVDPNDPQYLAFKNALPRRTDADEEPADNTAPPDYSPPVITNDDLGTAFAQQMKAEHGIDITVPDVSKLVAVAGG